ncbi:MAG TPA: GNAT family N-acetyltransferase [Clostridiales bacterium]|nr:GNAT family N-acetyltransferase [Clostridiales bacterium]
MQIKRIELNERDKALKLVLETFMQYEAPDYPEEGIKTFQNSVINNDNYLNNIVLYGAYKRDVIYGVIATRNQGNHIALFFVDGKYHRQGIGKKLFHAVLEHSSSNVITVNSSPYAVEIYHHLGFIDTAPEQVVDGIRYTPMIYIK